MSKLLLTYVFEVLKLEAIIGSINQIYLSQRCIILFPFNL